MKMTTKPDFQTREECIEHLKRVYTDESHPIGFRGISYIYKYYDGKLSVEDIQNVLSGVYVYGIHKQEKKPRQRNVYYVYHKR